MKGRNCDEREGSGLGEKDRENRSRNLGSKPAALGFARC